MAHREPSVLTDNEIDKVKLIIKDCEINDHINLKIEEGSIKVFFGQSIFALRAFNTPEGEHKYRLAECTAAPKMIIPAYDYDNFEFICLLFKIWCQEISVKINEKSE